MNKNDDDQSNSSDDEDLMYTPFSKTTPKKSKTKDIELSQKSTTTIPQIIGTKEIERARTKSNAAYIDRHITNIKQLSWHQPKNKKHYIPVRVCTNEEKVGLVCPSTRVDYCEELRCCGTTNSKNSKSSWITKGELSPMGNVLDEKKVKLWKDYYIKKFGITEMDMLTNEYYLQRIIDKLTYMETMDISCTPNKELIDSEVNNDEIYDDDEYDEPYTQAYDNDGISSLTSKIKEPIRPGDIIQYHDPIFVAGDKRGLKTASVLSVDRKRTPILILSSGEVLPSDTNVRRIKVMFRNKLEDHPFGIFRHITDFQLKTAGTVVGSIVQGKSDKLGKTLQKHLNKLHEKVGGDNSHLFHNGFQKRMKNDDSESCPTSVSYSSSSSTDKIPKKKSNYALCSSDDEKPLPRTKKKSILLSSDSGDDEPISTLKSKTAYKKYPKFSTSSSQESSLLSNKNTFKTTTLESALTKRKKNHDSLSFAESEIDDESDKEITSPLRKQPLVTKTTPKRKRIQDDISSSSSSLSDIPISSMAKPKGILKSTKYSQDSSISEKQTRKNIARKTPDTPSSEVTTSSNSSPDSVKPISALGSKFSLSKKKAATPPSHKSTRTRNSISGRT